MLVLTALVSVFVAAAIWSDWRKALPLLFAIGVLQDIIRKLMPGAPAAYILWIGAMFGLVVMAAYARGAVRGLRPLYLLDRGLRDAWTFFILVVALQAGQTLVRWGSPATAVLGLIFYLGPLVGLLVGFAYARSERWIVRLLTAYVLIMAPAALTVYLSAEFGKQWPVLRDVGAAMGTQMLISGYGELLESHPGVFRVGELAAWHAATSIAFLSILVLRQPRLLPAIATALLAIALIGAIILTGRRKMLVALMIFFAFHWILPIVLRAGFTRRSIILLAIAGSGTLAFGLLGHEEGVSSTHGYYVERSERVLLDTEGRLNMTIGLVQSAWDSSGLIGQGAGVTGQGARYAGQVRDQVNVGATEVGLGMILIELGLPGLLAMVWLGFMLVGRVWLALRILAWTAPELLNYASGFLALLIANAATFGTATQLYSDFVVLITLGLIGGLLFALLTFGLMEERRQQMVRWRAAHGDVMGWGAGQGPGGHTR